MSSSATSSRAGGPVARVAPPRLAFVLAVAAALVCAVAALSPSSARAQPLGFGPVAALNTNAATDGGSDWAPQLATDGAGNWVVVWYSGDTLGGTIGLDGDILVARSSDDGATWTAPAPLNTNAAADTGSDWDPHITTDGAGNWVAVWATQDTLGSTIGADFDILVARSTNNGTTWTAPVPLNSNAATDAGADGFPQVTTDGAGNWVAAWHSDDPLGGTIGSDSDILIARSTDDGATWTAPAPLNSNAATDSGDDYLPKMATDGTGNWVAVWRSNDSLGGTIGADVDVLCARSSDNGATWTAPAPLNSNAATDSGLDEAPQVSTDRAGNWVVAWHSLDSLGGTIGTDSDILIARSTDNGATWSAVAPLNTNAATDAGADFNPDVTTDGTGNWVAVWQSADSLGGTIGTDADILISHSTNAGATWTAPAALNSNAATDSGDDFTPKVGTDDAGNWLGVWQSLDSLGGTVGTDRDILVSRSNSVPVELSGFALD